MVGVENDHLRRPACLAARLDHTGERVVPLHERHRTGSRAAARQRLAGRADRRQVGAGTGTELEQHPLGPRQRQDGVHGVGDRVDEAGGTLRRRLEPAVEPHGAVECRHLVHQQILEIGAEGVQIFRIGKVPLPLRPTGDSVYDTADQLPHAVLALGRSELAAKVLGNHDVGRLLGPRLRDLDIALLEHHVAALVLDHRRAGLPVDIVERIHPRAAEDARKLQPGRAERLRRGGRLQG